MFPFSSLSQPLRTLLHNLSNLRPPHTHSLTSYLIDQMIATREVLYSSSTIKPINLPHNIFSYKNIQNVPNSYQSHNLLVSKLCTLPFLPFCIINLWISIRLVLNQDNFALPLPQPPHCSVQDSWCQIIAEHAAMFKEIFGCHKWKRLLPCSGLTSRILLNNLQ